MKENFSNFWYLWCKALGTKATDCNHTSDKVAIIRTIILATYLITNCVIVYGVIRTHHFSSTQNRLPQFDVCIEQPRSLL
jgi:hypothetical protein